MAQYSDAQIIGAIMSGGSELEHAMRAIYRDEDTRKQVFRFVLSHKGVREDAEDIWQDSIRNLILSVREGKYRGSGTLNGYLYGIARNLWYKRFRTMQREADPGYWENGAGADVDSPEIVLMDKEREEAVRQLLGKIDSKCRKVLEMWKLSYSMKEIAGELNYKTEGVARKKKRLCLKQLLEILDENPIWMERLKP
ncbi:MAG: sigma-70 family RNA polymerase sigma factor [Bacteroidia bacterium]